MLTQEDLQNIGGLIDKKFDDFALVIDKKFDVIDKRFDDVDKKFDDFAFIVNQSFSDMQKQIAYTNQRVDKLYDNVDRFIHLHEKLDQELTMMRARIERLEEVVLKLQTVQ